MLNKNVKLHVHITIHALSNLTRTDEID